MLDDDFLRVEVNPGAEVLVEHLDEIWAAYDELLGEGKKFYIIVILPFDMHHLAETRKKWRNQKRSDRKIAEAFVLNGLGLALIANFVMRVEKPAHTMSYFDTEEKAMNWLEEIRRKNK
ncbi:MAG: hypothetical protein IAF38_20515 [Bacteroidia bacterium]|nr:hypothetical protein [Bacteroidia bacterium]